MTGKGRKRKAEFLTCAQWVEAVERNVKIAERLLAIHTVVGVLMIALAIFRAVQGG